MLVAAVQMKLSSDLQANEQKILSWVQEAANQGVRVLNFPETSLTGYLFGDFAKVDLSQVAASLDRLHQAAANLGVSLIVGAPQRAAGQGSIYNSAVVLLSDGRRLAYHKMNLVTNEMAWFAAGRESLCFDLEDYKFGVMVCRDQNHPNLSAEIVAQGAQLIFICCAHYYSLPEARLKKLKNLALPVARAVENRVYVCKSNAVGWNKGLISLGGSVVIDPNGIVVQMANRNQEEMLVCDVGLDAKPLWVV